MPGSTPESTTATVTPLPVASPHDCGMPRLLIAYDDSLTYWVLPTSQSGGSSAEAGGPSTVTGPASRAVATAVRTPAGHGWLPLGRVAACEVRAGPSPKRSSQPGGTAWGVASP